MEPGKALDNWHSLTSAQHKSEMGSLRITAKFKVSDTESLNNINAIITVLVVFTEEYGLKSSTDRFLRGGDHTLKKS